MSGRYPQKTAKEFIKVLDNLESNAEYKGMDLDRLRIVNATVHKGVIVKRFTPRAMGRATAKNNVLTAIKNGSNWIDTTVFGMGRGAGNAKTEDFVTKSKRKIINQLKERRFVDLKNEYRWGFNKYYNLTKF